MLNQKNEQNLKLDRQHGAEKIPKIIENVPKLEEYQIRPILEESFKMMKRLISPRSGTQISLKI